MRDEKVNGWKSYVTETEPVEVEALHLQFWEWKERMNVTSDEWDDNQRGYCVRDFKLDRYVFIPDFFFDKLFECMDRWGPPRR